MDWVEFLTVNRVDYVTAGPNTKKGNISIKCPWCGDDDPSEHLSIALSEDAFGCWRNAKHSGRKPYSLVAALLGCSFAQARLIAQQYSAPDPANLDDAIMALNGPTEAVQHPNVAVALPPEFRQIKPTGLTGRFWRYLAGRGFDDVGALIYDYDLLCCQSGRWKDRIIIPLYREKQLIGWTARAIQPTINAPRYLSSSPEIKQMIFNEDALAKGGEVLYVTEGPFDAIKVDFYGEPLGIRATCLFGVNPTISQIAILMSLLPRFKAMRILLDAEAFEMALVLEGWISAPNVLIATLPEGVKDPGQLTAKQIASLDR